MCNYFKTHKILFLVKMTMNPIPDGENEGYVIFSRSHNSQVLDLKLEFEKCGSRMPVYKYRQQNYGYEDRLVQRQTKPPPDVNKFHK